MIIIVLESRVSESILDAVCVALQILSLRVVDMLTLQHSFFSSRITYHLDVFFNEADNWS